MRGDAFIHFVSCSRRVNIRLGVLLLIPKSPQIYGFGFHVSVMCMFVWECIGGQLVFGRAMYLVAEGGYSGAQWVPGQEMWPVGAGGFCFACTVVHLPGPCSCVVLLCS